MSGGYGRKVPGELEGYSCGIHALLRVFLRGLPGQGSFLLAGENVGTVEDAPGLFAGLRDAELLGRRDERSLGWASPYLFALRPVNAILSGIARTHTVYCSTWMTPPTR